MRRFLIWLCFITSASINIADADIIQHCTNTTSLEIECGLVQIEDIAVIPNTNMMIFAEFGDIGKKSANIGIYDPIRQDYKTLFDEHSPTAILGDNWGEKNCIWPQTISPHGIHYSERTLDDGQNAQQLLVVNHGHREQILFFQLTQSHQGKFDLQAKGCVTFPKLAKINDVVALDNGDFAATHMFHAKHELYNQLKAFMGYNTGFVYHWNRQTGLKQLKNSFGSLPNGIEANADKNLLFINMYFENTVKVYSLKKNQFIGSFHVEQPDNSSWSLNGELLVASHKTSFVEILDCFDLSKGSCGGAFDIIALNPNTGTQRTVYSNSGGEPFGPATIAVEFKHNDNTKLLMGSFSGDRIAKTREAVRPQTVLEQL
jgi:hypothetical protein